MALPVSSVTPFAPPVVSLDTPSVGTGTAQPEKTEFMDKLRDVLRDVNKEQKVGEEASQSYAAGTQNDLHGTMINMAQADISLRLVSNIRSRVIEAYREVMRMGA